MKTLALTLTLVSGLYLGGKTRAEAIDCTTSKDSATSVNLESTHENIATEAEKIAQLLLTDPLYSGCEKAAEEREAKDFELEITSVQAGMAAEKVRSLYE